MFRAFTLQETRPATSSCRSLLPRRRRSCLRHQHGTVEGGCALSTAHAISINAQRVHAHYDRVSKWYSLLCGEHIHQGYWESVGSIREAQEHLIARLARIAQISLGAAVLDVACRSGGSVFWLAYHFGCSVLGITNSRKQAELAWKSCCSRRLEDRVPKAGMTWGPGAAALGIPTINRSIGHAG